MPHPKGRGSADWKVSPASGRTGQIEAQRAAPLHKRDTAREEIKLKRSQEWNGKPLQEATPSPRYLERLRGSQAGMWITNNATPHVTPQKSKDGLRILSKTLNGRSFPQKNRRPTHSRTRKGTEQLPTHNNRNKIMELHSKKFQSEQHHERKGHFKYQSPTAKCQKYDMTHHIMKHPDVLRLRSTRKDASYHVCLAPRPYITI